MKLNEIKEIIDLVDQSNIKEFELEYEGSKIKIKKQSDIVMEAIPKVLQNTVQAVEQPIVADNKEIKQQESLENYKQIKSPMVGTFYKSASPGADAFVKVGDRVNENTVVCIIEAMKLFNEIKAEVCGEIVEILVQEGELIEYGQPLFLVK